MARYFGIDEANERLADVAPLLEQLKADRDRVAELQPEIERAQKSNGSAEHAEELARNQHELRLAVRRMHQAVNQIDEWGVTLRDINTGLIDFPAEGTARVLDGATKVPVATLSVSSLSAMSLSASSTIRHVWGPTVTVPTSQ